MMAKESLSMRINLVHWVVWHVVTVPLTLKSSMLPCSVLYKLKLEVKK